ncbi:MAG: YncE family protein [Gemmataceae bacterium]
MKLRYVSTLIATVIGMCSLAQATAADSALELVQTIVLKGKAGKLDHLCVDRKRERLFLANTTNGTLDVVDLKAGKLLKQISGQTGIQGVAYADDLDRVFVGLGTGGLCNVFEGQDYKLEKTIKFADDADNVRYDPTTHQVFVAHAEASVGIIDAKNLTISADVRLPGNAEGLAVNAGRLFVGIPSPSNVVAIDVEKKTVVGTYPVKLASGGHPVTVDAANHRVFMGCRQEPSIVVMDEQSGKEITSVAIPPGVDDLYFDAKRKQLYASCGDGFLVIVRQKDADHYEVAEKLSTIKGAKTSCFDEASGRIYLAVPRQKGQEGPEIRVYQLRN